jgi:hypothetical protein
MDMLWLTFAPRAGLCTGCAINCISRLDGANSYKGSQCLGGRGG